MPKNNNFNFITNANNGKAGVLANTSGGMQQYPSNSAWRNILGDVFAGLAAAAGSQQGGLFNAANTVLNRMGSRDYYNQLKNYINQDYQDQQRLANAYGGVAQAAGVQGLPYNNMPVGFDLDKIEVAGNWQKGNNTATDLINNYQTGSIQQGSDFVDPSLIASQMEKFLPRQLQAIDSTQYNNSFYTGRDYLNNSSNPTPLNQPTPLYNIKPTPDKPILDTLNGGVSSNNYDNSKFNQPSIWNPILDKDLMGKGLEYGYKQGYEAPKIQAETKEILQGNIPYKQAQASKEKSLGDAYNRGPGIGNYPPAARGSEIDPNLSLSRLTGIIDNDIGQTVSRINNINDNLSKKDLDKNLKAGLQAEKNMLTSQLQGLFVKKNSLISGQTQQSSPVSNNVAPIPSTNAAEFLRKKGIK